MPNNEIVNIAVLMATRNGMSWIAEQVKSILSQQAVNITLVVSDDGSTDGTWEFLQKIAEDDGRIILLQHDRTFGTAGKNFYYLLTSINSEDYDFIALADQDDIWLKNKLQKQVILASKYGADGISSNVVAFWPDGSRALIDKAEPMRRLDFLFESAGPGCTFLLSSWLVNLVQMTLNDPNSKARDVELHDWLIYAICRSSGRNWYINPVPGMKYRQHSNNVMGVNFGYKARWSRFRNIINGWYRGEVVKLSHVSISITSDPYIVGACRKVIKRSRFKFTLLRYMNQARRNVSDRLILSASILLCLF